MRLIERMLRIAREKGDDDKARALLEKLYMDSQEAVNFYVANTKIYTTPKLKQRRRG
jgi:hypothetical protein